MTKLKDLDNWQKLIEGQDEFRWVNNFVNKFSDVQVVETTGYKNAISNPRGKKESEQTPDCYLGTNVYVSNPYTGCLHGCSYCYAQYFKAIEHRDQLEPIIVKKNFAHAVCNEISRRPSLQNKVINFGSATDPYQPLELHYQFFRHIIPFFKRYGYWFYAATKSNLVIRDIDLLKDYEKAWVGITLTSLDDNLMRSFEPDRPAADLVLDAIRFLIEENIRVVVRIDPLIPGVNDNLDSLKHMADVLHGIGVKAITSGLLKAKFAMLESKNKQQPIWRKSWYQSTLEYKEKTGIEIDRFVENKFIEDYPYGYRIPSFEERVKILAPFAEYVNSLGISFSVCEMGMDLIKALSPNCSRICACVYGLEKRGGSTWQL